MKRIWDCSNWKPYNGIPCKENEVLAPMVLNLETKEFLMDYGLICANAQTWRFPNCSKSVPVVFVHVPKDDFEKQKKLFNHDAHEYLSNHIKDERVISLDKMYDDINSNDRKSRDLTGSRSFDEKVHYKVIEEDFIKKLKEIDPQISMYIILKIEGFTKGEIFELMNLNLKKTQRYEFAKKAEDTARVLMKKEYGI